MPHFQKKSYTIAILLLLTAVGFFVVSWFTFLYIDDFCYSFIVADDEIKAFASSHWFPGFYVDRFAGVGRFFPHLMVAFFTLITGKAVFNFFSTAGFLALSHIISVLATPRRELRPALTLLAASVTWLAMPGIFEGFLWMAGACNYLFVAIIVLLFYRLLTVEQPGKSPWWSLPLWGLFGFVTGWSNEGFIIGLSAAAGIYYVFLHRELLNRRRLSMLLGLWAGTICLCLTPFNLYRFFSGGEGGGLMAMLSGIISSLTHLGNLYVSFTLICLLIAGSFTGCGVKRFLRDNLMLILAWAVSILFILLTGFISDYSRMPIEVYALALLVSFVANAVSARSLRICSGVLGVAAVVSLAFIIPVCVRNYDSLADMRTQIQEGKSPVIVDNIKAGGFVSRYFKSSLNSLFRAPIPRSEDVVRYYGGTPGTLVLSKNIVAMLADMKADGTKFATDSDIHSLWIPVPDGSARVESATLHIRPMQPDEMNILERAIAPYFSRYSMTEYTTDDFNEANLLGQRWIVLRHYPYISDRIYDVTVNYHQP